MAQGDGQNTYPVPFTLSGTGNGFVSLQLLQQHASGTARGLVTRQDAGGDGTSYIFYAQRGVTAIAALPDDVTGVIKTASIASTPSATTADLDTDFDNPRAYNGGLVIAVDMTTGAGGAWVLDGTVHIGKS